MTGVRLLLVFAVLGGAGCGARITDAPGTVFVQPSIATAGSALYFDRICEAGDAGVGSSGSGGATDGGVSGKSRCFSAWRVQVEGVATAPLTFVPPVDTEAPPPNAFAIQGGRPGDTTERTVAVLLLRGRNEDVVSAARVSFILPWTGVKAVAVDVPPACSAIVPGTLETCDVPKLPAPFVDITQAPDYRPAQP